MARAVDDPVVVDEAMRRALPPTPRDRIIGAVCVLAFLALWEGAVDAGWVNPLFSSSPSRIVAAFVQMVHEGSLGKDIAVSAKEFMIGYVLAVVVGTIVGVCVGWYRDVRAGLQPFISSLYATPRIALLPLLIIWFGIGTWPTVAIVFLGAVFPMIINVDAGVRSVDLQLLRAARSFGASDRQIFASVVMPGSAPFVLAGLRLAVGHGLIGVVVGELFAASAGLGYEIAVAGQTFETGRVFVGIVIIAAAAVVFMGLLQRLEDRFNSWQ